MFSNGIGVTLPFAFSLALVSWLGVYEPISLGLLTLTAQKYNGNSLMGAFQAFSWLKGARDDFRTIMAKEYLKSKADHHRHGHGLEQ